MEALQVSFCFSEVLIRGARPVSRGSNHPQTTANLRACGQTTSPNLRFKIRIQPRPSTSGVSFSVPSFRKFGASRRSVCKDDIDSGRMTSRSATQVLNSKINSEMEEAKLLEAFRDALNLDSFILSAYDTAWVAMIPNNENTGPFYPETLEWICSNQCQGGAWGDDSRIPFDHILSTLACLVALKTWNKTPERIKRGETFLQDALIEMKKEDLKFVSPGVFHIFAELLEEALRLGISLPYSSSVVKHLRTNHAQLLDRLRGSRDLIKACPRRLLSFPEGLQRVIPWNESSELQSADGDLFSSPAATACLVMKTRDSKAFGYLDRLLDQFGTAVPSMYPKRVSHVLNLVDHFERLNLDRYFHKEIREAFDKLFRGWNLEGHEETKDEVYEIVSFRALREHSYNVLPETSVFEKFCNSLREGEKMGVGCVLDLYRASELKFPGEEVLDHAKDRSTVYLTTLLSETLERDQSNLVEEINDVLCFPSFLKNRPVESMAYMDRFQFKDLNQETYVERGFSRTANAGNLQLLAFAKSNFNACQALYQKELQTLARWEEECRFMDVPFIRHPLYPSYLTAVGFASAPALSLARTSWTMNSVLTTAVDDLFDETSDLSELRLFVECVRRWDLSQIENCAESLKIIAGGLLRSVDYLSKAVIPVQGRDLSHFFRRMWLDLVVSMMREAEWTASGYTPSLDEYMETAHVSFALGPIVPLGVFFLGEVISDEELESQEYWDLFRTSTTFGRLLNDSRTHQRDAKSGHISAVTLYMQEHPELTAEQSTTIMNDMVKGSLPEVLSKLLNPSYSCPAVRMGWLSVTRALCMMYYGNVDGFSVTPGELKKKIERFLFHPYSQV